MSRVCAVGMGFCRQNEMADYSSTSQLPIFTKFGLAGHVNPRPLDMFRKGFSKMLLVGVIYPKTSQLRGRYLTQTDVGTHCREIVYSTLQSKPPRVMQYLKSNNFIFIVP